MYQVNKRANNLTKIYKKLKKKYLNDENPGTRTRNNRINKKNTEIKEIE